MSYPQINKIDLDKKIVDLINNPNTVKVLATKDKNGAVHVVFKGSIKVNEVGNITVVEVLESSQTSRNLTHAIWFNEHVAITVKGEDNQSYQIKGIPYKDYTFGDHFEKVYKSVLEKNPDADVAGIWEIIPDEVRNETFKERVLEQKENLPILGHADRDFIG